MPAIPHDMESTVYSFLTTRSWQTVAGAITAAVLIAGNPFTDLPAEAAPAAIKRISGDTRLATAARVAEESFPSGTEWAVLTGADDWHATLGSAPLAGQLKAAQLLAWPDRLDETSKTLERLGVKRVIIVGSIAQISGSVERQLREKYTVERLSPTNLGEGNQYELARQITARTIVAAGGKAVNTPGVVPVTGEPGEQAPAPDPTKSAAASPTPSASTAPVTSAPTPLPSASAQGKAGEQVEPVSPTPTAAADAGSETATAPTQDATQPANSGNEETLAQDRPTTPKWQVPAKFAEVDGKRTLFIASGKNFPDALAASAVAYRAKVPLLYVDASQQQIPEHTALAVKAYAPQQIIVLGGTSAVGESTIKTLQSESGAQVIQRLSGPDRVATSVAVADWSIKKVGFDPHTVSVARGDAFPDAVTAGQYAANHKSPIVLSTGPKYLTSVPVNFVLGHCKAVKSVVGFGGRAALDDAVLKAFSQAGGCTKPSSLPQVTPSQPGPKPTPTPTTKPTASPTTSPTPPGSGADPMTSLVKSKWKIHPEVNRQIRTNASGLQDKISTLSVLGLHGTNDGSKLPKKVNWGLLSCNKVRLDGAGSPIFTDANRDGYADGLGHTSNEGIDITGVNNRNVANGKLLTNQSVVTGMTNAILTSGIDDCAWVAAFDPADNNKIKVNKDGRPITPLGLGWLRIGNGPKPGEHSVVREVNPKHIYNVTPEDSTKKANTGVELTVKRKDGKPISHRLSVVAMPCKSVLVGQGDVLVKPMPTDPRAGLGYGNSDNNRATVTHFMGKPEAKPRRIFTGAPQNGQFKFTVNANAADCGSFMVIEGNGNGKLDIDAARRPTEPFGVATVRWTK